jgi:hypothetical protein
MRSYAAQKAGLTRAVNSGNPVKIQSEVIRTITEWENLRAWPDDWHRWNVAYNDTLPWYKHVDISTLAR